MTKLARLLAPCAGAIMLPERHGEHARRLSPAGLPRMDVSASPAFERSDLTGIVAADWQRSQRSRKK